MKFQSSSSGYSTNDKHSSTFSPQLTLSATSTEQPAIKSNPISPADDEPDFLSVNHEKHETSDELIAIHNDLSYARDNRATSNENTLAVVGNQSNYILDGQGLDSKLSIDEPGNWFARQVPKLLTLGLQSANATIIKAAPSAYSKWMSPPRNFHPIKRNWKSPPLLTTPHVSGDGDPNRGAIPNTVGSSQNGLGSYKASPPPRKRITQKNTPSPFRSRSLPGFIQDSCNSEGGSTSNIAFRIDEAGAVPGVDSSVGLGSFSPMGFHNESHQSFGTFSPSRCFPAQQVVSQNGHLSEDRYETQVKTSKNRSPFSRFISEMSPLRRGDSMINEGYNDLFEIDPVIGISSNVQGQQRLLNPPVCHPARAYSPSPQDSSVPFSNQSNNKLNPAFNGRAYSPMPNLDKIRSLQRTSGSTSGTTIVKLGQNTNSLETQRCFKGINSSMQRESRAFVEERNRNSDSKNPNRMTQGVLKQGVLSKSPSSGPQRNTKAISLPPFLNENTLQALRNSPPSPPASARQIHHPMHEFFYDNRAPSVYHLSSVPIATANIHEGYPPSFLPHIPPMPSHFYPANSPYTNAYSRGKADRNTYVPPRTPAPHAPASYTTNQNENKENVFSSAGPPSGSKNNPCNCKKSKCLKLYCECFASEKFCLNCNCTECWNDFEHADFRNEQISMIKIKNPQAFIPRVKIDESSGSKVKHNTGCRCKRSACLKKYCECFEAGANCGEKCKCVDCSNYPGSQALIDRRLKIKDSKGAKVAMETGVDLWREANVPVCNSDSVEKPVPIVKEQRESHVFPQEYPHYPYRYPEEDTRNENRTAPQARNIAQESNQAPNSSLQLPSYATQQRHVPQRRPMLCEPYPQNNPSHIAPSQLFLQNKMTPTIKQQQHPVAASRTDVMSEKRPSVTVPIPPQNHEQDSEPCNEEKVAPTPISKSASTNSTLDHCSVHGNNETPQLLLEKRQLEKQPKAHDQESTVFTLGSRVPKQPKNIVCAIFSFLSKAELCKASLVSKEWSNLLAEQELVNGS